MAGQRRPWPQEQMGPEILDADPPDSTGRSVKHSADERSGQISCWIGLLPCSSFLINKLNTGIIVDGLKSRKDRTKGPHTPFSWFLLMFTSYITTGHLSKLKITIGTVLRTKLQP